MNKVILSNVTVDRPIGQKHYILQIMKLVGLESY